MSGHNKWSQIKLKKGKTDAKRSQIFSKYAKLIANEARKAKGNRNAPALRAAIERARKENMPSDNIARAIKKATEGGGALESVLYEAYGPGGVALLIEVLTDSRNRVSNELKFVLSEHGGHLASPGAAAWAFKKLDTNVQMEDANNTNKIEKWSATTTVPLSDADVEKLDTLVEALEANEDVQEVFTNAE
jgi:YebC/PmpR family DNA-binding regulatory protein